MLQFPYPVKFVAANNKEFNIRVTKPTKRSWWLQLLDDSGEPIKVIKVNKASEKLRYANKGGLANGQAILKSLLREQSKSKTFVETTRKTYRKSASNR